jgi:hypothetical protein
MHPGSIADILSCEQPATSAFRLGDMQERTQPRGEERVLSHFLGEDGRLRSIPTKHAKLLVVLDHLSQQFEPGRTYPEAEVNDILTRFHPDYAALRRYLVENAFMTRADNVYWRSGGTFTV